MTEIGKGYFIRKSQEESLKYGNCYRKDQPSLQLQAKINDTRFMDAQAQQFLHNEISILKMIQARGYHPNLLHLVETFQVGSLVKIILFFINGRDFENVSESEFHRGYLSLTRDLARAIKVLHDMNIVHRDIKPKNVIYSHDGVAVLIDYGVSCSLTQPNSYNISNCLGSPGTLDFIDPLIKNTNAADKSSDIYSFAATMFFALTGKYPKEFSGETLYASISSIPVGSPAFKQMLLDSLSLEKARRPSIDKILDILNQEPVTQATQIVMPMQPPQHVATYSAVTPPRARRARRAAHARIRGRSKQSRSRRSRRSKNTRRARPLKRKRSIKKRPSRRSRRSTVGRRRK